MKLYKIGYFYLAFIVISFSFCSKSLGPSGKIQKSKAGFDAAAFNEVYVEALKQKLLGNGGDALKYLEQCIKINSESDASYYQMAQIVIANGDIKNGKKYLSKALSINKENIWYLTMLAGLYYQEKNLDSSIVCYEKVVKYYPDKENLQLTLGNLYAEDRKFGKANFIFESFDKKYGINESSTLSLVKNLISEGKYDDAMVKAEALLKEYPEEVEYNGVLADIYRGKGENQKALDVYKNLLERNPDDAKVQLTLCDFLLTEKSYNDLFILLNTVLLNNKVDKESKITLMAKIIEIPELDKELEQKEIISLMILEANFKDDNIIPLLRPELMLKENKLVEATERLEEIIKTNPENYFAWEKLLIGYLQLKDYNKLCAIGEECAMKFNTSLPAKLLYANGALETGKYSIALEELKKAEILAGENKDLILQVLTMRADVYYRMKDYSKAFETFEEALKNNNDDLTVINNYAYYLAEQNKNLKEAEVMAKKVIEKDKGNTTFLDTYGWVLYKRGKLKEAAKVMESVISKGEKSDAVWYEHYGYILKKQNKCKEAVYNWSISLKIDSSKTELIKEIRNCEK
jgi:tetratricopeptide (TPR) repeat protein